jgi:predicted MFS family arabinose efflux permease
MTHRLVESVIGPEPMRRLVVAHSAGVAGDALFTVSLAGSLFFNVSVDAARPAILLYLLLTMAPFAVVAPFVGPLIDRYPGSQRALIAGTNVARAIAMVLIAWQLTSLMFFPLAFVVLVLGKAASVAKSSLVPWLVRDETRLVAENARLSRVTAIAAGLAGAVGAAVMQAAGAPVVLVAAAAVHAVAVPLALRIPRIRIGVTDPVVDDVELRSGAVNLAANAMSALRAGTGFLAFLLAFTLKVAGEPAWFFGLVIAAGGVGSFIGTFLAGFARRHVREETILALALVSSGAVALVTAAQYQRTSALIVAGVSGIAANVGRQAFDSLTQRLAPDAEKGRAFARFETKFQVTWVIGALIPVLLRPSAALGLAVLGAAMGLAGAIYLSGLRALRRHQMVVASALGDGDQDVSQSLLAMASALHSQRADRLAITTAVEAVRVAAARAHAEHDLLDPELSEIWTLAATATGPLPEGRAERALELARTAVEDARRRTPVPRRTA